MNERPTHIDLFSGIGGFSIAAQWAGFQTVAFCEIDAYCQAVLKERFGAVMADACCGRRRRRGEPSSTRAETAHGSPRLHADIRTINGRLYARSALLTGGFPCQPFSVAGKRAGAADDRFLWPEMLRVIDEARPAWVLGENVAGIVQMELDRVLSDLESLGYSCWPLVIPACAVDARHRRDRVWIVANSSCELSHRERGARERRPEHSNSGKSLAHADEPRPQGRSGVIVRQRGSERTAWPSGSPSPEQGFCEWLSEPDMGRVAHGVSKRVDRLKGLGNSIVPQVAYEILSIIRLLL